VQILVSAGHVVDMGMTLKDMEKVLMAVQVCSVESEEVVHRTVVDMGWT
jgi:hypothetical protein